MPLAGVVTIVLVVVAIVVIALFLIRIATVLRQISRSLSAVIGAVGSIPEKTGPIEPVLGGINRDLATARGVLEGLLAKKLGSSPPPSSQTVHHRSYENRPHSAPEPELAPEPEPDPSRIVYQRSFEPAAAPQLDAVAQAEPELELAPPSHLEPVPGPPPSDERPHLSTDRIVYRHESPGAVTAPPPAPPSQTTPASELAPNVIRYRRRGQ